MLPVEPVTLEGRGVRIEPLQIGHADALAAVVREGMLQLLRHRYRAGPVIVWHTDNFNYASQRAITRLGAKLDGVLRHDKLRPDGTVRDTYQYSMIAGEWPESKAHLTYLLDRHSPSRP